MLSVEIVTHDPQTAPCADLVESALISSFYQITNRPTGSWAVTVKFAGSSEISELHSHYFDDSTDTDVMSFPSGDDLEGHGGYLGDIAISVLVAITQATHFGHTASRECAYLALHGLLHLLGYRDDEDDSRAEMLALQDELFASWDQNWIDAS